MLKVYTTAHPASHKDTNHSNINMNTICVLKKCIQIDFSEYTLFLNTLKTIVRCFGLCFFLFFICFFILV